MGICQEKLIVLLRKVLNVLRQLIEQLPEVGTGKVLQSFLLLPFA
ncbi:MAG: hypothetical protein JWN02_717 [Acidobacteria bacterium]|nr:hypothetical protein [Acidobacteriota bacterium]